MFFALPEELLVHPERVLLPSASHLVTLQLCQTTPHVQSVNLKDVEQ